MPSLKRYNMLMVKAAPTYEYLHEILSYDPLTGVLSNKTKRRWAKADHVHIATNTNGYIVLSIKGRQLQAHRIIWFMMTGVWPDFNIDHENTIPTDNTWTNLREATNGENNRNRSVNKKHKLGIKGVYQVGKRFKASVRVGGKGIHLGYYDTAQEASDAYAEAAKIAFGEFARAA